MNGWQRGLLIAALLALGVAEVAWRTFEFQAGVERMRAAFAARVRQQQRVSPLPPGHHVSRAETYAFLDAVKRAETIAEPIARCLAYPAPPGSHWSSASTQAYCRYQLQPLLGLDEMRGWVEQGQAAELDRRLAAALHAQQTRPESRGLLDRIYRQAFDGDTAELRAMLDAWKRQSPDSPFALAASGNAYVRAAAMARGGAYARDTPASSMLAMDNLLDEARVDLRRAIALNPKITPAYTALINADGLNADRRTTDGTIRQALDAVPDDYSIYSIAMWTNEPKWGGSLAAMDTLAAQAQAYAADNPLLALLMAERPFYEADNCGCDDDVALASYASAFDRLASLPDLRSAGQAASRKRDMTTMAIYPSEVLRFQSGDDDARISRAYALLDFDEPAWAVADLDRVLARSPENRDAREAHAYALEMQENYAGVEKDLRALSADDPDSLSTHLQLGRLYVRWRHWDQAWAEADRLIHDRPDAVDGWILRAKVQELQPRDGLAATVDQLQARFHGKPGMDRYLLHLHATAALRRHGGADKVATAH